MSFDDFPKYDPPKPIWEEKPVLSGEAQQEFYRSLPPNVQAQLRKNGVRIDSVPKPGEISGVMQTREHRARAGHLVTERFGDPRCWMEPFMPPIKHTVVALRSHTDPDWYRRYHEREENIGKYNSPIAPSQAELEKAWQKTQNR